MSAATDARGQEIERLRRARPRDRFLRGSLLALLLLCAGSWFARDLELSSWFSERRARNFERFVLEATPEAQREGFDLGALMSYAQELLRARGYEALLDTLAIAVLAIVLAALASLPLSLLAARNFMRPSPYLPSLRPERFASRWLHRAAVLLTRALLIAVRALPEYVWAFLFIALFGAGAWPAVLALAVHNAGVLGRLNAETVENTADRHLPALRGLGASRPQLAAIALFPAVLPRFLLYFFYRWETCVREATVLGMLGVVSLGYWIADARSRGQYDAFLFYVALGGLLVLLGDLLSALLRRIVRRAS